MMGWLQKMMHRTPATPTAEPPPLVIAEAEVSELRIRADSIRPELEARLRRNYWSDTVAAIARRDRP